MDIEKDQVIDWLMERVDVGFGGDPKLGGALLATERVDTAAVGGRGCFSVETDEKGSCILFRLVVALEHNLGYTGSTIVTIQTYKRRENQS